MPTAEMKSFDSPDETPPAGRAKVDIVNLGGYKIQRFSMEPGWKWSTDMKPIVNTDTCHRTHMGVCPTGRIRVRMDDGSEIEYDPNEAYSIPPGHDGWVVGDEPATGIEWSRTSSGLITQGLGA